MDCLPAGQAEYRAVPSRPSSQNHAAETGRPNPASLRHMGAFYATGENKNELLQNSVEGDFP
jgi:hypothetical protein